MAETRAEPLPSQFTAREPAAAAPPPSHPARSRKPGGARASESCHWLAGSPPPSVVRPLGGGAQLPSPVCAGPAAGSEREETFVGRGRGVGKEERGGAWGRGGRAGYRRISLSVVALRTVTQRNPSRRRRQLWLRGDGGGWAPALLGEPAEGEAALGDLKGGSEGQQWVLAGI